MHGAPALPSPFSRIDAGRSVRRCMFGSRRPGGNDLFRLEPAAGELAHMARVYEQNHLAPGRRIHPGSPDRRTA